MEPKPKKKSKRTRWIILAAVAVVVVAAVIWFAKERPLAQLRQSRALATDSGTDQIVTAFIGDLSAGATASGWLLPQREAHLALGITGQVEEVYVEVGDEVRAGDVLIQLDASSLERAVRSAEQSLAIQEASLAELRQGASDEEITAAEASVTQAEAGVLQAEASVSQAKANLAELRQGASEEETAAAEASLDSAKASLATAQAGLVSAKSALTNAELARDSLSDADVTAEANLKSAQAGLNSAQAQLDALLEGADAETIEQARLNWEQAKNSLWNAQLERDAVKGQPGTPGYLKDQMEVAVANAEIAVRVAEINYLQAQKGATDEVVAAARASVAAAEAQVAGAQAQLDDIDDQIAQAKATVVQAEASVTQAEAGVLQAEASVTQAEANLAMLLEGASEEKIAAAEAQVAQAEAGALQAEAQVAQAEANLATLLKGASEEKLAMAEAQVEQARIALEDAQDNLAKATLKAPFDGVATEVYISVGEWASGLAVDLMDTGSLEVVLDVDEIDIGRLAVGQQAVVTLETWPDEELTGELVSIAPKAKSGTEIVTYQVRLSVDAGELPIRSGMTANAELVTASRENVLLVPNRTITADRQAGKYYVNLVQGDAVTQVEVTIGLRDNKYTEITSGLEDGDQLVIGEVEEVLDFTQGPPQGMRRYGQ
ncbi:MAG: efflux RND transporter periplasmic adaptor subunit [Anaerolineae bacterium]